MRQSCTRTSSTCWQKQSTRVLKKNVDTPASPLSTVIKLWYSCDNLTFFFCLWYSSYLLTVLSENHCYRTKRNQTAVKVKIAAVISTCTQTRGVKCQLSGILSVIWETRVIHNTLSSYWSHSCDSRRVQSPDKPSPSQSTRIESIWIDRSRLLAVRNLVCNGIVYMQLGTSVLNCLQIYYQNVKYPIDDKNLISQKDWFMWRGFTQVFPCLRSITSLLWNGKIQFAFAICMCHVPTYVHHKRPSLRFAQVRDARSFLRCKLAGMYV